MRRLTRISLALLIFSSVAGTVSAEKRQIYPAYEHVFAQKKHVDGSPLLIDGKTEFYLFPGAERAKYYGSANLSCGGRILSSAAGFGLSLIRSAAGGLR